MTSSSRLSNSSTELLRAPYAAPQMSTPSPFPNAVAKLVPFVPLDHRDVTVRAPIVGARKETPALGNVMLENDVAQSNVSNENEPDLPWIEAFVQHAVENTNHEEHLGQTSEDSWPMGEAAKRLDELTESLTSIDASRALLNASEKAPAEGLTELPAPPHSMWNDDEWMDIMPTSSIVMEQIAEPIAEKFAEQPAVDEWQSKSEFEPQDAAHDAFDVDAFALSEPTSEELAQPEIANVDFSEAMSASYQYAEITARALEGLAERVRAGEIPVPAVQQDVGDAAVLAAYSRRSSAGEDRMSDEVSLHQKHLVVEGLVQGVGFRWFVRERARRAGLSGWVRNRDDGSVELWISGHALAIERVLSELAVGPKGAVVRAIRELPGEANETLPYPFVINRER